MSLLHHQLLLDHPHWPCWKRWRRGAYERAEERGRRGGECTLHWHCSASRHELAAACWIHQWHLVVVVSRALPASQVHSPGGHTSLGPLPRLGHSCCCRRCRCRCRCCSEGRAQCPAVASLSAAPRSHGPVRCPHPLHLFHLFSHGCPALPHPLPPPPIPPTAPRHPPQRQEPPRRRRRPGAWPGLVLVLGQAEANVFSALSQTCPQAGASAFAPLERNPLPGVERCIWIERCAGCKAIDRVTSRASPAKRTHGRLRPASRRSCRQAESLLLQAPQEGAQQHAMPHRSHLLAWLAAGLLLLGASSSSHTRIDRRDCSARPPDTPDTPNCAPLQRVHAPSCRGQPAVPA
jgi:hypothetical protein